MTRISLRSDIFAGRQWWPWWIMRRADGSCGSAL